MPFDREPSPLARSVSRYPPRPPRTPRASAPSSARRRAGHVVPRRAPACATRISFPSAANAAARARAVPVVLPQRIRRVRRHESRGVVLEEALEPSCSCVRAGEHPPGAVCRTATRPSAHRRAARARAPNGAETPSRGRPHALRAAALRHHDQLPAVAEPSTKVHQAARPRRRTSSRRAVRARGEQSRRGRASRRAPRRTCRTRRHRARRSGSATKSATVSLTSAAVGAGFVTPSGSRSASADSPTSMPMKNAGLGRAGRAAAAAAARRRARHAAAEPGEPAERRDVEQCGQRRRARRRSSVRRSDGRGARHGAALRQTTPP